MGWDYEVRILDCFNAVRLDWSWRSLLGFGSNQWIRDFGPPHIERWTTVRCATCWRSRG